MAIVRQTANLSRWNPASSDLDIDSVPTSYDTQGKLGSLPPAASQLDFDGALPSPVNFFLNTKADGFTLQAPFQVTQFKSDGQTSQFGFASALPSPVNYFADANSSGFKLNAQVGVSDFIGNGQTSLYGFASALPSPVDNILNINADGFTLNAPFQVTQFKSNGQTSQYGFASALPSPVDSFLNIKANGFTLQAPFQVTQFIDPGNSSQYGFAGPLPSPVDSFLNIYASGFTLNAPPLVTQFLDPGNQSIYGFAGGLPSPVNYFTDDHSKGFTLQAPFQLTQFQSNGQTSAYGFPAALPSPVNFFLNTNANGFTLQAPFQVTQFKSDGQTSIYGFASTLPAPTNFFADLDANGFTLQTLPQISHFTGINGTVFTSPRWQTQLRAVDFFLNIDRKGFDLRQLPLQSAFTGLTTTTFSSARWQTQLGTANYFTDLDATGFTLRTLPQISHFTGINGTVFFSPRWQTQLKAVDFFLNIDRKGFLLRQPALQSMFTGLTTTTFSSARWQTQLKVQDRFIDALSGAVGFTLRQPALETQFIGTSVSSYTYPSTVLDARLMNVGQGPWVGGIAKLENQLGAGSPKFGNTGWYNSSPYTARGAGGGTWTSLNAPGNLEVYATTRRSPSPLDNAYTYSTYYGHDLKLRSTAYNPSYINHPLILRGLQDGIEPQRWGTGTPFEGHPPRGGIVTALERSAVDVIRIGKILASPQGIVWNINQLLLAKMNPLSEMPVNRIRIGPAILGAVAGNAFGQHIRSNNIGPEYGETVQALNNNTFNRLVSLKKELLPPVAPGYGAGFIGPLLPPDFGSFASPLGPILTLSGPGGPGSAGGIGFTTIRRAVSSADIKDDQSRGIFSRRGSVYKLYAGLLKPTTGHNSDVKDDNINRDKDGVDEIGIKNLLGDIENPGPGQTILNIKYSNTEPKPIVDSVTFIPNSAYPGPHPKSDSNNVFTTLEYSQIKALAKNRGIHTSQNNNFRKQIQNGKDVNNYSTKEIDYDEESIEKKYGFGRQGIAGRNRSNPYTKLNTSGNGGTVNGDKINALNYKKSASETSIYDTDVNDFIQFYFAGINMGIGNDDVIPFRATVKNISDSFNPSWSPISIMGRPDSPALYSSFERSVSFDFAVAATSREELVPMWRKLNYLATFTMPIYGTNSRPQGPIMRLTIGHMYRNLPGYITNLSIAVNEEATWDISSEGGGRQLPNIVDVNCTFNIIHDYRAQKGGAVYSLYDGIYKPVNGNSWIADTTVVDG